MRFRGFTIRGPLIFFALGASLFVLPVRESVRAAPPVITIDATGVKVQVASAPLSETIDALSRAAGFKVTYEGPRPTAMLFNAEIGTATVAETLFRLLDGQDLNYGVVFDLTGRKVTSLMVLGPAAKKSGATATSSVAPGPRSFAPPRNPRNELPTLEEDPAELDEADPEPLEPEPTPSVVPPLPGPQPDEAQRVTLPPSPFAPRPLEGSPFAPRPLGGSPFAPRPTPSPLP